MEYEEKPEIKLWSRVSNDSSYIISVSPSVASGEYSDNIFIVGEKYEADYSLQIRKGSGVVRIYNDNDALLKEYSYSQNTRIVETINLASPRKVVTTFSDFSGMIHFEFKRK